MMVSAGASGLGVRVDIKSLQLNKKSRERNRLYGLRKDVWKVDKKALGHVVRMFVYVCTSKGEGGKNESFSIDSGEDKDTVMKVIVVMKRKYK